MNHQNKLILKKNKNMIAKKNTLLICLLFVLLSSISLLSLYIYLELFTDKTSIDFENIDQRENETKNQTNPVSIFHSKINEGYYDQKSYYNYADSEFIYKSIGLNFRNDRHAHYIYKLGVLIQEIYNIENINLSTVKFQDNKDSILNAIALKLNPISFNYSDTESKNKIFKDVKQLVDEKIIDKHELMNIIIPNHTIILSIIYTDAFARSILKEAYNDNPSSDYYRDFLFYRDIYYPVRESFIELFDFYFSNFKKPNISYNKKAKILKNNTYTVPTRKSLSQNHQNALDIFFNKIKNNGKYEIGPEIYSMTSGIVVASENDWQGGTTFESYKNGGISPKSGNGVIIYDPTQKWFIFYFHMYKTTVKRGDIIKAGDMIGYGGNTGLNAQKKGHGKHLHIEIYDWKSKSFFNCYKLKSIIFGQ